MEKPAVVTIEDNQGEIVYMQFIDMNKIEAYKEVLDKMNGDYVEILDKETGDSFYTLGEFVEHLLNDQ